MDAPDFNVGARPSEGASASGEPSLSRRSLVIGAVGVAGMFAIGGAGKALAGDSSLLRPPGAQDEALMHGACIKCDRCRSVCPEGVIDVAHLEDGVLNARTPKMNFRKGACTFCDGAFKCAEVCPTSAIAFGFDPWSNKIGVAVLDTDQCLLYRSGSGKCSKECATACPYDAIHADETGRIVISETACNGCGACEHACPSASYGGFTGSQRRGINVEPWEGDRR